MLNVVVEFASVNSAFSEFFPKTEEEYNDPEAIKPITPSKAGGLTGNRQRRL